MNLNKSFPAPAYKLFCLAALLLFSACSNDKEKNTGSFHIPEGLNQRDELRFRQYAVQGRLLYKQHCENCHKEDGSGLGRLIPPLAGSDYLQKKPDEVLCIIRYGKEGPLVVNGQEYNQPMPPNPDLTAIEVAEIATYIQNAWGNTGDFVSVKEATGVLSDCREGI